MRTCIVQRRDAERRRHAQRLRRWSGSAPAVGAPLVLDAAADWYAVLHDVFGLELRDIDADERARLWRRIRAAHEAGWPLRPDDGAVS